MLSSKSSSSILPQADTTKPKVRTKNEKKVKSKKSIYALVIASGAAASFSLPKFFSIFRSSQSQSSPVPLSSTRRTYSMSVLRTENNVDASLHRPKYEHPTPRNLNSSSLRPPPLPTSAPTTTQLIPSEILPRLPTTLTSSTSPSITSSSVPPPRRIASAPSLVRRPVSPDVESLNPSLFDDGFEWFVPSVRAKVVKRMEKELGQSGCHSLDNGNNENNNDAGDDVKRGGGMVKSSETWDDDFEIDFDVNEIAVPTSIQETSQGVRDDIANIRLFALHIEDLKLLHLDAKDMASGLAEDAHPFVGTLLSQYSDDLEQCEVLIDLAEYSKDTSIASNVDTERHLRVLREIIKESGGLEILSSNNEDSGVHFAVEMMPLLIGHIGPLKGKMNHLLEELRELVIG